MNNSTKSHKSEIQGRCPQSHVSPNSSKAEANEFATLTSFLYGVSLPTPYPARIFMTKVITGGRRGLRLCMFGRARARELPRKLTEAARRSLRGGRVPNHPQGRRTPPVVKYGLVNDLVMHRYKAPFLCRSIGPYST